MQLFSKSTPIKNKFTKEKTIISLLMKTKSLFLFLIVLFTGTWYLPAQQIDRVKLDSLLNLLADKNKAMGSLAILEDGKVAYAYAIGYVQLNPEKVASNDRTKYRIGSISKMFTATLIFQLIDEGKLQLSTTLDKYYPEIPNADKITIGNMLSHRSGIFSFTDDSSYLKWSGEPKTHEDIIKMTAEKKSQFEPGTKTVYSNSNFVLLGYIIEDICAKPYNAVLQSRICSSIGLQDTYYGGKTDVIKNESYSFRYVTSWEQVPETDMSIPHGAGALVSTPSDLVKFIAALFQGKLVSEVSLNHMKTIIENNLGMGMMQFPYNDKTVYGHGGAIDGFNSMLCYFPDEKLAVSYISNGTVYSVNDIVLRTINICFNKPDALPVFQTFDLKPEDLNQYLGVYSSTQIPIKITFTRVNDNLMGQGSGQPSFPLSPFAKDVFKFEQAGITITFDQVKKTFLLEQGGGKFTFTKE
jgi:CubicO group peptidase (beta-lactamase class C family)